MDTADTLRVLRTNVPGAVYEPPNTGDVDPGMSMFNNATPEDAAYYGPNTAPPEGPVSSGPSIMDRLRALTGRFGAAGRKALSASEDSVTPAVVAGARGTGDAISAAAQRIAGSENLPATQAGIRWLLDNLKPSMPNVQALATDRPDLVAGLTNAGAPSPSSEVRAGSSSSSPARIGGEIGVGGPAPSRSLPRNGAARVQLAAAGRGGAFTDYGNPDEEMASVGGGAFEQPPQGQPVVRGDAAAPGQPGPSDLGADYTNRVANIGKPSGDLTQDQKNRLQLDFFLNLLASNKPGSRFLQNVGEAGKETSAEATKLYERNLALSREDQNRQREDVFRSLGLTDKSQDNAAKLRALGITERHYNDEAAHNRALETLEKQKNDIMDKAANGKIAAAEAALEVKKIEANIMLVRASMAQMKAETDPVTAKLNAIDKYATANNLKLDPATRLRMALGDKTPGDDEATLVDQTWKSINENRARSGLPGISRDEVVAMRKYGGQISRSHPDYRAALKDPAIGGDKKKLDAALQSRGLKVVD